MAERDVLIDVPDGPVLHFPFDVARSPADFDAVISLMLQQGEAGAGPREFEAVLQRRLDLDAGPRAVLSQTYGELSDLRAQGRNHIWGFVARNLVRPVWLSSDEQRADVVIGNPPWLSYRFMSRDTQRRFRDESQRLSVWQGGNVATQQDLSAYFFARCRELYLKPNARIAFVMPYAAMSRRQFEGFRSGIFRQESGQELYVRFTDTWALGDDVQPLFPVPSCVLFARDQEAAGPLPATVRQATGELPRRNATETEADKHLVWRDAPWPAIGDDGVTASPYQTRFRNGATLFPRVLCLVEQAPPGLLGVHPQAPLVVSRRSRQEKLPWKRLDSLTGNVERAFLRPVYLGESVVPFRLLEPVLAVVPWDRTAGTLLDEAAARLAGYPLVADWVSNASQLWDAHKEDSLTFIEQIDYYGKLSAQFPQPPLRVVYSKSGTLMVAALVTDPAAVIDHTLYWAAVKSHAEAHYLIAVLTSETARRRIAPLQARGQWGERHFDKLPTERIPDFDATNPLHAALAAAGRRAEAVAAAVPVKEGAYFITARRQIREALAEDGIAGEVNKLVEELLRNR